MGQQIQDDYRYNNKHMHFRRQLQLQQDFHSLNFVLGFGDTTVVFIVHYSSFSGHGPTQTEIGGLPSPGC